MKQVVKLTQKQENFCLAYIETGDASEAYRTAYKTERMKPTTVNKRASEALKNGVIAGRVQELRGIAQTEAIMTRTEALERLTKMSRVNITDIAEFEEVCIGNDSLGNPVMETVWRIKNSNQLSPEAAASIKSVTATKNGPKLEMHDPMTAITQLGKMQGWEAAAKFDHQSSDGSMTPKAAVELTDEQLMNIINGG